MGIHEVNAMGGSGAGGIDVHAMLAGMSPEERARYLAGLRCTRAQRERGRGREEERERERERARARERESERETHS